MNGIKIRGCVYTMVGLFNEIDWTFAIWWWKNDLSIFDWQSFSVESWAEVWMAFFWKIVKEIFYSKGAVVAAYFVDVQYQRIGFETINRKFSSIFNYLQLCKRDENIENGCWEWPILKFS